MQVSGGLLRDLEGSETPPRAPPNRARALLFSTAIGKASMDAYRYLEFTPTI